jgi:hypothetical protein
VIRVPHQVRQGELVDLEGHVIGKQGLLTVATRGAIGPGEVLVTLNGSSEAYLAWSETPLSKGSRVLVISERGLRTVDVASCDDSGFPLLGSF